MYRIYLSALPLLFITSLNLTLHAQKPEVLVERGKLIFSDDFNRTEKGDTLKELGNGWETNTKDGNRTDLKDDVLVITKGKAANHSLSVKHVNPFDDGVVKFRFQLFDKQGLKVNFNDKKAKKVTWAGHISRIIVQPNSVTIRDDITGVFDLKIRAKRQDKTLGEKETAKLKKFLATKQAVFKTPIKLNTWYEMTIVNVGPKVEVYVDGKSVGAFSSEGLDHKVKQNMAFGVSGKVAVDDVQVWSLD